MRKIWTILALIALAACTTPTAPNAPPGGEETEEPQQHTAGPEELDPCEMLLEGCEDEEGDTDDTE